MGDNADNTTFLLLLSFLQLTASIYYNEAAIGKGEEGEEECDGAGFEGAFLPSSPPSPFLFAVPIYQSSNKLISDIDLPLSLSLSLAAHHPIHSVRSAEGRK